MSNRASNPRPKRAAEDWTRAHHEQKEGGSPKKARFDLRNPSALAPDAPDEEEDAYLEADELTRRGAQTKRNAVNIDGFESDSSNEGFDGRADAKAKAKKEAEKATAQSKDEEENDMFADLEEDLAPDGDDDEDLSREGKKNKSVKFADLDKVEDLEEIEDSKSGGHVKADLRKTIMERDDESSSSGSDTEVGDEERAEIDGDLDAELGAGSKKKHAPKLDAFNLNAEKEEGRFDESLNFVRKAVDPDAVFDSWMEGTSKKDMRRAKDAQDKRDRELRQKNREDDSLLTSDVLGTLISHLERGENSLEALARLAPKKDKKKPNWQQKKRLKKGGAMDVEAPAAAAGTTVDEAESKRRAAVEAITGSTDVLMSRGIIDINDTREMLTRYYQKETGQEWQDDPPHQHGASGAANDDALEALKAEMWEFRWLNGDGQVQGPSPLSDMQVWFDAGYFFGGAEFRRAGSGEEWRTDVVF